MTTNKNPVDALTDDERELLEHACFHLQMKHSQAACNALRKLLVATSSAKQTVATKVDTLIARPDPLNREPSEYASDMLKRAAADSIRQENAARAEFEAKFPMPPDCIWTGNGYSQTRHDAWRAKAYANMWEGWKARSASAPSDEQAVYSDYAQWRMHANGMFGILSEIVGTGVLARYGNNDLLDRVELAIANHEQMVARAASGNKVQNAMTEERVRFCPECGHMGEVSEGFHDCCPEGSSARVVPKKFAETCQKTFKDLVNRQNLKG